MKKFLLSLSIASIFTACSTEAKKDLDVKTDMVPVNTAGYAMSNSSTDVGSLSTNETYYAPVKQKPSTKTTTRRNTTAVTKEKDYTVEPAAQQIPAATTSNANTNSSASTTETKIPETVPGTSTGASIPNPTGTTTSTGAETSTKKKGWSDAAKGAAIGGVAGAIGGAVINGKNRGVGAAIGAVIGAAGGYVIGRKMDKNKQESQYSMAVN